MLEDTVFNERRPFLKMIETSFGSKKRLEMLIDSISNLKKTVRNYG